MLLSRSCRLFAVAALIAVCAGPVRGESFLLKSGGQVEGEFLNPNRNASEPYLVRTPEGVKLTLGKDLVAKVVAKREAEHEYERLLPKVPDTAAGHWQMAEWCKENGLRSQRELHLREVIAREPDHTAAHQALGHQRFAGKWQLAEEYMASQGYVKYEGAWRTRQDVELAKAEAERNDAVITWRRQIDIWRGWIGKKREAEAFANLRAIRDPSAAPPLIDLLTDKKQQPRDLRLAIIDVLSEMDGNPGEQTFIALGLSDPDERIRDACIDELVRMKSKAAVIRCMGLLQSKENAAVNRAARVLGRLNDPMATLALIEALNTTHEVLVVPGQQQPSGGLPSLTPAFDSAGGGGLSAGGPKPQKVKVTPQNDAVLRALNTIHPGVNFGYNEAAWKQWYVEKNEPVSVNLRRAD
jgi:hypothetical protein